jgi:hypothetical protein
MDLHQYWRMMDWVGNSLFGDYNEQIRLPWPLIRAAECTSLVAM